MFKDISLISIGDFVDLYHKARLRGVSSLVKMLQFTPNQRIKSKWNHAIVSSDFWNIPEVRLRWNEKCTGNPNQGYEDYFVNRYLLAKTKLRLLSVGCGSGARERKFAQFGNFERIEGIDCSQQPINQAKELAKDFNNIHYSVNFFEKHDFRPKSFDVILFNSSLHHFSNIDTLLKNKVIPILKDDGYLVIFEYVGPNRLQWTSRQLKFSNSLLQLLPENYRLRANSRNAKSKIYRPGLLRMKLIDPSEAIDSASIIPSLHKHFKIVEEKSVGTNISHLLLKDISHNFMNDSVKTKNLISHIFEQEDKYLSMGNMSDYIFGIYQQQENQENEVDE